MLRGKNKGATSSYFSNILKIQLAENKGTRDEVKIRHYTWRNDALKTKLELEVLAYIITEINNQVNKSSGYLGFSFTICKIYLKLGWSTERIISKSSP